MTAPDRIRERLVDDQGRINSGIARVRCISLARAVVELLEALDDMTHLSDHGDPDNDRQRTAKARATANRQRSRFDL